MDFQGFGGLYRLLLFILSDTRIHERFRDYSTFSMVNGPRNDYLPRQDNIKTTLASPSRSVLLIETKFTRLLGCSIPIQQAGMAALANPELAAAVSEAGALGMVSVGGFPPEKVTQELQIVRKRTSHPFG